MDLAVALELPDGATQPLQGTPPGVVEQGGGGTQQDDGQELVARERDVQQRDPMAWTTTATNVRTAK